MYYVEVSTCPLEVFTVCLIRNYIYMVPNKGLYGNLIKLFFYNQIYLLSKLSKTPSFLILTLSGLSSQIDVRPEGEGGGNIAPQEFSYHDPGLS